MFDCHYDLLTNIYMKRNDISYIKDYCKKIYRNGNITGGIFNLFYMNPEEMKDELNIDLNEINIIENLKLVKNLIEKYYLIPNDINYIFGIEGLDYLKNIDDLDVLYSLGVRSVTPVWNNDNKFGGGIKAPCTKGLTVLGKQLITKLVSLGIAIDLSHSNEKTFFDIVNLCINFKKEGLNPIVFASHSNAKALCNVPRNLTDEQILKIKELDGVIGLVSIKRFCIDTTDVNNKKLNFEEAYINQIKYLKNLLDSIDNIAVSSDDMSYYYIEPQYYKNANVFPHEQICKKIRNLLLNNNFSAYEIEKILHKNFIDKIQSKYFPHQS